VVGLYSAFGRYHPLTGISRQDRKGGALAPPAQGPHSYPCVSRPAQSRRCGTVRAARGKRHGEPLQRRG
jgi:hypothetical protein